MPICGASSKVNATLPVQAWVMRVPASCGKRSRHEAMKARRCLDGSVALKLARPPKISRRRSPDMR
jgi:hypothetical protein